MSTDAVAVIGFVALFVLMLLRVPVGMAMGLVGVAGFGYLTGGGPALKIVGHTPMRTVTDWNFAVDPAVPADGRVRHHLGHEPRAVPRRQRLSRPSARRARHRHHRRLRRLRGDLRLVGGDRRHLLARRLSGDAPLRLSAALRHRRDRRRRHARHHDPALDGVRRLRPDHRAGHRQAVHRRHHARHPRHRRCTWSPSRSSATRGPASCPPARAAPGASGSPRCATSGRRCCCSSS